MLAEEGPFPDFQVATFFPRFCLETWSNSAATMLLERLSKQVPSLIHTCLCIPCMKIQINTYPCYLLRIVLHSELCDTSDFIGLRCFFVLFAHSLPNAKNIYIESNSREMSRKILRPNI